MSDRAKITDYPPWIQNAVHEIYEGSYDPLDETVYAEIISRHHEVEPKFVQSTPADTARAIDHFARELLAEIQYKGHNAVCPVCRKSQHKPDCRLARMITKEPKSE